MYQEQLNSEEFAAIERDARRMRAEAMRDMWQAMTLRLRALFVHPEAAAHRA